jgi:prepilin-type N-terminal cleavage/methylation domain-containing protein
MNIHASSQKRRSKHSAFTLVELLLVIAIISVLAAMGVGVLAQAQNDAAVSATRSRINIIQKILEAELENYEVKRSPVSFAALREIVQNSASLENDQMRVHVRNLKRMIIADLIRAEMPDGSRSGIVQVVGDFPSATLDFYLRDEARYTPRAPAFAIDNLIRPTPETEYWNWWAANAGVTPWALPADTNPIDVDDIGEIDEERTEKSELLYAILSRIDADGVPAVELLGSQAIDDTDGDQRPEIVDAWGDPIFLQWQQVFMTPQQPEEGVWSEDNDGTLCGLSCEHGNYAANESQLRVYAQPISPAQIRPFLISRRLQKIDGDLPPAQYSDRANL